MHRDLDRRGGLPEYGQGLDGDIGPLSDCSAPGPLGRFPERWTCVVQRPRRRIHSSAGAVQRCCDSHSQLVRESPKATANSLREHGYPSTEALMLAICDQFEAPAIPAPRNALRSRHLRVSGGPHPASVFVTRSRHCSALRCVAPVEGVAVTHPCSCRLRVTCTGEHWTKVR